MSEVNETTPQFKVIKFKDVKPDGHVIMHLDKFYTAPRAPAEWDEAVLIPIAGGSSFTLSGNDSVTVYTVEDFQKVVEAKTEVLKEKVKEEIKAPDTSNAFIAPSKTTAEEELANQVSLAEKAKALAADKK